MTREQVETILASLKRWDEKSDYGGSHWITPCEDGESGEFVQFDDVRAALEQLIDAPQH